MTLKLFGIAGLALALLSLSPASAALQSKETTAQKLIMLLSSKESIKSGLAGEFDEHLVERLSQNSDYAKVLRSNPDAPRAVAAAVKKVISSQIDKDISELWQPSADLLSAHLTEDELRQVLAFYSSPVGSRIMAAARGTYDDDPSHCVNLSWVDEQTCRRKTTDVWAGLTASDQQELSNAVAQPGFQKLVNLKPQLDAIDERWSTPSDEETREIQAAIEATMQRVSK